VVCSLAADEPLHREGSTQVCSQLIKLQSQGHKRALVELPVAVVTCPSLKSLLSNFSTPPNTALPTRQQTEGLPVTSHQHCAAVTSVACPSSTKLQSLYQPKANMRTLTNNSDDVIIWGFQNIPGPGASHDFQRAGTRGDQQNTWSDVTLKFQQPHRFQQRCVPETFEVGLQETLKQKRG